MKLYKYITVMVALCLLLSSCGGGENTVQTSEPESTTTEAPAVETSVPIEVVVEGKSEFSIIRSIDINGAEQNLFLDFQLEMNERTGHRFKYLECYEGQSVSDDAKEILLGSTNRAESAELAQKLEAAGGNRFGILVKGNKIAIAGSDVYQIYRGLDYFMQAFLSETDGKVSMTVEDGYEYISEAGETEGFSLEELVADEREFAFFVESSPIKVPSSLGYNSMQGGGCDGKHAYAGMIDQNASPEMGRLHKFDIKTGELLKVSEPLPTNHTNDMTFDSKNGRLVVVAGGVLCFVDPDTMECTGQVNSPIGYARAIEYLPSSDGYVIVSGHTFSRLDAEFNVISSFEGTDTRYVTQGLCCDEKYIYDVRYDDGGLVHAIVVYDMQGNHIGTGKLFGATGEPENMFICDGDYYIGSNRSNDFSIIELMPDSWW